MPAQSAKPRAPKPPQPGVLMSRIRQLAAAGAYGYSQHAFDRAVERTVKSTIEATRRGGISRCPCLRQSFQRHRPSMQRYEHDGAGIKYQAGMAAAAAMMFILTRLAQCRYLSLRQLGGDGASAC